MEQTSHSKDLKADPGHISNREVEEEETDATLMMTEYFLTSCHQTGSYNKSIIVDPGC